MNLLFRHCRDVTRLVLLRQERPLTLVERFAVHLHLGICRMCRHFGTQVRLMDRAMAQWKHYAEADEPDGAAG